MMTPKNNTINYVEFKAHDLDAIKTFYNKAFGWNFTNYGDSYISFSEAGLEGGFEKTEGVIINGVLVVLYHEDLIEIKRLVIEAGGDITVEIFSFPGGKRFQFKDPSGNELAVWTHVKED